MRKSVHLITLIALLIALSLAACNAPPSTPTSVPTVLPTASPTPLPPTATAAPTKVSASGAGCVVGSWEVSDFNSYMSSALPADAIQNGEVVLKDTTGSLVYVFDASGKLTAKADKFQVQADINVSSVNLPLLITINGTGIADYQVAADATGVDFSDFDVSGLSLNVTLAGNSLGSAISANDLLWFNPGESQTVSMAMQCSGDTLQLTPPIQKANIQPVVFKRVTQ
jgi:hypothetical protein